MKEATLKAKIAHVDEVTAKFQESQSAVVVDCIGLTVAETMALRKQLYASGCEMHVIKNNIIRRASEKCGYNGLEEALKGPSAVAFSKDATSASKIVYGYAKTNDKLKIKAGVVEGKVLPLDELKVVATLPDKNGMLSMLLSVLQAPIRNMACVIKAVAEKNE
ncbi:MAG: 50S ribosomal protein L10 [Bacilli bacterium]|nr:50S ribosomal protein L10 [Acholeplasmataceae bacterium]MDY2902089.1 50S ribosomal protein L10 [Bacilli bacterium]